jgi:LPS sulfotransferase NodH
MPRSGSHLLSEALQLTGLAGRPDEYFFCDEDGRFQNEAGDAAEIHGKKTLEEFRQLALTLGTTPNGVFAVVLMGSYFNHIISNFQTLPQYQELAPYDLLSHLIYDPKYIWLVRRDKLAQAISMHKAMQTHVWGMPKEAKIAPKQQPLFDYRSIDNSLLGFEEAERHWQTYFQNNNIIPFKVVYEELVENYEQTVLDLLAHLGITPPAKLSFANKSWQKQADALNEEWAATYRHIKNQPSVRAAVFAHKVRCKIGRITVRKWLNLQIKPPSA